MIVGRDGKEIHDPYDDLTPDQKTALFKFAGERFSPAIAALRSGEGIDQSYWGSGSPKNTGASAMEAIQLSNMGKSKYERDESMGWLHRIRAIYDFARKRLRRIS